MNDNIVHLRPLGRFAPQDATELWSAARLDRFPEMPDGVRAKVVQYLRTCPVFHAWMEVTRDEIGNRFVVEGGSAIHSDGAYFWRADAADYIDTYGCPVPAEALEYFAARNWMPPRFERAEYLKVYGELDEVLGGGDLVG